VETIPTSQIAEFTSLSDNAGHNISTSLSFGFILNVQCPISKVCWVRLDRLIRWKDKECKFSIVTYPFSFLRMANPMTSYLVLLI